MLLLPHLFDVATNPDMKEVPRVGLFRSPAIAWIYRHVFLSILEGETNCKLEFANGSAAWLLLGIPGSVETFAGDTGMLALRASLGDPMLRGILTVSDENRRYVRVGTVARPRDLSTNDVARLDRMVHDALPGAERASTWFTPANVPEAARAIAEWANDGAFVQPMPEIEIGSHRSGGRGLTITI